MKTQRRAYHIYGAPGIRPIREKKLNYLVP